MNYPHWTTWEHYFKLHKQEYLTPELFLYDIVNILPKNIDTIINFGCASGRDFKPFNKEYKLIGFDIAPFDEIVWVDKFLNLEYHECSIYDFVKYTNNNNILLDLSNCLVYTQGTMMYENKETQENFFTELLKRGCKNFIFNEYLITQPHQVPNGCLQLNPDYFNIYCFRKEGGPQPYAHISLDIPQDQIVNLFK